MKNYLNLNVNHKAIHAFLKLRTGNHHLAVRVDCYKNKQIYEKRLCELCNLDKVETVFHYMAECPLYDVIRQKYISFLKNLNKSEFYNKINRLKSSELKSILIYSERANEIREEKIEKRKY